MPGAASAKTVARHSALGILRVLTCGSVDDGKSTLLGRLLFDTASIPEDQLAAIWRDNSEEAADLALLLDGLEAEREQGITIDVTHRAFASPKRTFRLLDAPGHEEYTCNMASAASGADVAVLLIDAERSLTGQTLRHASICSLFGVRHAVLTVNKMDAVGFAESRFREIVASFTQASAGLAWRSMATIPVSALNGDNVVRRSENMSWWDGPPLLAYLEDLDAADEAATRPLRFPVQLVLRDARGRRYAGTVASGQLRAGDIVSVTPSGRQVSIKSIAGCEGPAGEALAGEAVTLALGEDADLVRGDILSDPSRQPSISSGFAARVVWFAQEPLLPGRSYLLRIGTAMVPGAVTSIRHVIEPGTLRAIPAETAARNEIALCNISLVRQVAFDAFEDDPRTGSFILIDRLDYRTVGAGLILHDLGRATNVHEQALTISPEARAAHKGQRPAVLWFTGLSGSGKSTIANLVEEGLWALGCHTMLLDGDNLRRGLNKDLGFTEADRVENIRRVGEVAKLMTDAGLIVICSFISPYRSERRYVRELIGAGDFLELFVDTPLSECIRRDPKGLYAKALAGRIPDFTGVSAPYETPEQADLRLETLQSGPQELAQFVIDELRLRNIIVA